RCFLCWSLADWDLRSDRNWLVTASNTVCSLADWDLRSDRNNYAGTDDPARGSSIQRYRFAMFSKVWFML
ncbi:MAG: hypothetical protein ABL865_00730, partial [Candidatus Nitrotoga sp.]